MGETQAQNVGIGVLSPDQKLHIASTTSALLKLENTTSLNAGIMSEMYFKTGTYHTGAIKTIGNGTVLARLGFFTFAAVSSSNLIERMSIMDNGRIGIGTNDPGYLLDVNGRMRVRNGSGTAGIYFMDAANSVNRGFVGMFNDNTIGLYGENGGGWGLKMSTNTGNVEFSSLVSILAPLYISTSGSYGASISTTGDNPAVKAESDNVAGTGTGVEALGGEIGAYCSATVGGAGNRYGIECYGQNGVATNYGIRASGAGGSTAYGIFATAFNATTNWAGYFSGNVFSTGTYQGSDRKLKSNIQPVQNSIQMIKALKPSTYIYKTSEFGEMQLPEGQQYGLVADEVKQMFPSLVKQAVQPAYYENDDHKSGRLLSEEVTFEAVNYTGLIPVLIAAMQEQQAMIEAQKKSIEELEAKLR
jgi:hypothetical protein